MASESDFDFNFNDINTKYDFFEGEVNINTYKSGLNFLYMNVNTLRNKIDKLERCLIDLQIKIHVIVFVETSVTQLKHRIII